MKKPNLAEIEARLTPDEAPAPPAGLAERIKAEIPEALPAPVGRRPGPRRWLIAASFLVAIVGGLVAYRTAREVGDLDDAVRSTTPAGAPAPQLSAPAPAPEVAAPASDPLATPAAPALPEATVETAPAPTGAARSAPPPAPAPKAVEGPAPISTAAEVARAGAAEPAETPKDPARPEPEPAPAPEPKAASAPPPTAAEVLVLEIPPAKPEKDILRENELQNRVHAAQPELITKPRSRSTERRLSERTMARGRVVVIPDPTPIAPPTAPPSTGGTAEPNDQPHGDMFFKSYGVNPFIDTEDDKLSTFGLDVDTGSWAIVRRYLDEGHLPPGEAVRVEEMINYFDYGDAPPKRGDFALYAQAGPAPFASGPRYRLLRFGVRAREVRAEQRDPATLIFVVDVSGSMNRENRLGLVKRSLALLLDQLRSDDRVGLVVYGSRGEVLLEPTGDLEAIRRAIDRLAAGGSTNAEEGLVLAYELAGRSLREEGITRVILCSDGVANVGRTGPDSILERIGREAKRGVELTTVGFGMGNYNDVLMEQLADRGDGRYAYVDDLAEARRIFVENLTGTLQTIAADAKAQVEFNPAAVSRYRLLGYENRDVADDRFRDDTVDAGEIGAGHAVTALYEIKLVEGVKRRARLATLHLRWRSLAAGEVIETSHDLRASDLAPSWETSPPQLQLAAVVAEFGEILRHSFWAKQGNLDDLFARAQKLSARFEGDLAIAELATLIGKAARLSD